MAFELLVEELRLFEKKNIQDIDWRLKVYCVKLQNEVEQNKGQKTDS